MDNCFSEGLNSLAQALSLLMNLGFGVAFGAEASFEEPSLLLLASSVFSETAVSVSSSDSPQMVFLTAAATFMRCRPRATIRHLEKIFTFFFTSSGSSSPKPAMSNVSAALQRLMRCRLLVLPAANSMVALSAPEAVFSAATHAMLFLVRAVVVFTASLMFWRPLMELRRRPFVSNFSARTFGSGGVAASKSLASFAGGVMRPSNVPLQSGRSASRSGSSTFMRKSMASAMLSCMLSTSSSSLMSPPF
mmetsp:Transcript_45711/g.72562  ORF Transcript_45711/g.72562 Transcript_45711/m.72562 type:complete len:248 (+) Transcript_45711:383-1126(+)